MIIIYLSNYASLLNVNLLSFFGQCSGRKCRCTLLLYVETFRLLRPHICGEYEKHGTKLFPDYPLLQFNFDSFFIYLFIQKWKIKNATVMFVKIELKQGKLCILSPRCKEL